MNVGMPPKRGTSMPLTGWLKVLLNSGCSFASMEISRGQMEERQLMASILGYCGYVNPAGHR